MDVKLYEWNALLDTLKKEGFIEISKAGVRVEETYLESVIDGDVAALDNLRDMQGYFVSDGEALISIGSRAYTIGLVDIQKAVYMSQAIAAYEQALSVFTLERFPMQYGTTQNNLGNAYSTLAEVEAKADNCKKAIAAYEQALSVFTLEELPEVHQLVARNLAALLEFCRGE